MVLCQKGDVQQEAVVMEPPSKERLLKLHLLAEVDAQRWMLRRGGCSGKMVSYSIWQQHDNDARLIGSCIAHHHSHLPPLPSFLSHLLSHINTTIACPTSQAWSVVIILK